MSVVSNDYTTKTFLHAAWVYNKSESNSWRKYWTVLRDNILFLFLSDQECLETLSGRIHFNGHSTFYYGKGDPKNGFKFDMIVSRKKYRFKVNTVYEREVWRAYVEGVITGKVPQGVILSPQDIERISSKLRLMQYPTPPPQTVQQSSGVSSPTCQPSSPATSVVSSDGDRISFTGSQRSVKRRPSVPSMASTGTGSSSGGEFDLLDQSSSGDLPYRTTSQNSSGRGSDYSGGPVMNHKFNREGTAQTPTWFFSKCSRDLAEKILNQRPDKGNTLMRVCTARNTGSYAISKRLGSGKIVHHEVMRVAQGYKISADNCPGTNLTLTEVMDCFIDLSGQSTTHPLTCNNLQQLGFAESDYDFLIVGDKGLVIPCASDSEDGDNYEVPVESSRPVNRPPLLPAPAPPAPAPAPPPAAPVCSPATPASPPACGRSFKQHKTWGRDKTEEVNRQGAQEGLVPKTMGPAERKSSASNSGKPSVMLIKQKMQENSVLDDLDVILGQEGRNELRRGSMGMAEKPPPLPDVPADRPKLNSASHHQPLYVNASSLSVPADVAPPSVVKPGGGWGSGGKIPPPTAPKNPALQHRAQSVDVPDASENPSGGGHLMQELQHKMQLGFPQLKHVTTKTKTSPAEVLSPGHHRQLQPAADSGQAEGQLYEEFSHDYNNTPPRT